MLKTNRKRLGDLLKEVGLITEVQLKEALEIQKNTKEKLGKVLINSGIVTEQDILQVIEFQLGIPHVDLQKFAIDPSACTYVPESMARRYCLIPIKVENQAIVIAMSDPLNVYAIEDVKLYTGKEVQVVIALEKDIEKAIDKYYSGQNALKAVEEFVKEKTGDEASDSSREDDENEIVNNAPTVKLLNSIIEQGIRSRVSDIHIEPFERNVLVRYRIDGELQVAMTAEKSVIKALVARAKIISGLNIAEKRLPQDGRISFEIGGTELDLRLSTLPTIYGEKIVIRVIDKKSLIISKDHLGFTPDDKYKFESVLKNPNGIILVTGPTGSGKTTTLYGAIHEINKNNINIVTIEDPVEAKIEGVNQVQVNAKAGLTFAAGLRSILRQDPDVIVIGEIRDAETASIAVRAAITGHLVISTLHTNSSVGSIIRLIDMGIEPFLVSSSMMGVIAQRLARKVCKNCDRPYEATDAEKKILEIESDEKLILHKGVGCTMCSKTGYLGRKGIYEIMLINQEHRRLINQKCTEKELKDASLKNGMVTLKENAKKLVLQGEITISEYVRLTHSNE